MSRPIQLSRKNEISIAAYTDDIKYVRLMFTEDVVIPIELGAEVIFKLRVTEIDRTEKL